MSFDLGTVGALALLALAVLALTQLKTRHRGRGKRRHRSLSKLVVHKVPIGKKPSKADRDEELLAQARAYFKANPDATSMPLEAIEPQPSLAARGWARLVESVRGKDTSR